MAGKIRENLMEKHGLSCDFSFGADHSGSIQAIAEKYPQMQFVSNAKVFAMLPQFFEMDVTDKKVVVAEEIPCLLVHTHLRL